MENQNKYDNRPIRIDIFANPNYPKETVMVFSENVIEGWGFADYVANGCMVLTPDTFAQPNSDSRTQ